MGSCAAGDPLGLVDHHVHSVVRDLDSAESFERFLSESGRPAGRGRSHLDSFLGAAVVHSSAPVLDLPSDVSARDYVARRIELGGEEANRRLLSAAAVDLFLVDHGFRGDDLVDVDELARLASTPVRRIVRLEQLAENVVRGGTSAGAFADAFAEALSASLSGPDAAVGCKSVLAYRHGLDVDPAEPGPGEVREAAAEWLAEDVKEPRLSHPALLRHLVWAGLRAGVPLQFHTGYGDSDLDLHRSNPLHLTELIRRSRDLGAPVMLLHCYPYHREAAYLAGVYPDVYFDIGLAVNYVGHRATAVLAEALESAPFHTMLYSSDAFGLAELHHLAAVSFRRAIGAVLEPLSSSEQRSDAEVRRVAEMIGSGTARRVYRLG